MKIPINETRIFLSGELDNGVKYVVVEDNKIDTSAVSVVVKVGSFNDPKEFQGLAHFLEHMLFMGSDKYPEENYFEQKIKSNGGISNAYTDKFETVYYFNVISGRADDGLGILCQQITRRIPAALRAPEGIIPYVS